MGKHGTSRTKGTTSKSGDRAAPTARRRSPRSRTM
ncbi:hypothetical protein ACWEV4_33165 [Streptomyces sp. NPDC003860]